MNSYTVGVKSMSPDDIELLFVNLYNTAILHHIFVLKSSNSNK